MKASRYCEQHYDCWYILSAKHGLVHPETVIAPYDLTLSSMGPEEREKWATKVYGMLIKIGLENEFFIHAGEHYREICKYLRNYSIPLKGMSIGRQLQWYNRNSFA